MARARSIKPGFFENEVLSECSPYARLLFIGLWMLADREGRLEDRPKRIKGALFAHECAETIQINTILDELMTAGFILRYTTDGVSCIEIVNFLRHQRPHHNEVASTLPAPSKTSNQGRKHLRPKKPTSALHDKRDSGINEEGINEEEHSVHAEPFDEFWEIYPPRKGRKAGKRDTRPVFAKIDPKDIPLLLIATANYAASCGEFARDPIRFLKGDFWRDFIEPASVSAPSRKSVFETDPFWKEGENEPA
jgi:hypothetical protein